MKMKQQELLPREQKPQARKTLPPPPAPSQGMIRGRRKASGSPCEVSLSGPCRGCGAATDKRDDYDSSRSSTALPCRRWPLSPWLCDDCARARGEYAVSLEAVAYPPRLRTPSGGGPRTRGRYLWLAWRILAAPALTTPGIVLACVGLWLMAIAGAGHLALWVHRGIELYAGGIALLLLRLPYNRLRSEEIYCFRRFRRERREGRGATKGERS